MESIEEEYTFEKLLNDIREDKVGAALYVSNLDKEQMAILYKVLTKKTSLTQVTFVDCDMKNIKSTDWCGNSMPFSTLQATTAWGDGHTVHTVLADTKPMSNNSMKWVVINGHKLLCTPLHEAIYADDTAKVIELLENGASPHIPVKKKDNFMGGFPTVHRYPLQLAVEQNNTLNVQSLLMHGADPRKSTFFEGTAIDIALKNNNAPMVQLFARAGCLIDLFLKEERVVGHLANTHFPFQVMKQGNFNPVMLEKAKFPHAANTITELTEMLKTYSGNEKELLYSVCRYKHLRYKDKIESKEKEDSPQDPENSKGNNNSNLEEEKTFQGRTLCYQLMNLIDNEKLFSLEGFILTSAAKAGTWARNLPNVADHEIYTIFGEGFELGYLPRDLQEDLVKLHKNVNPDEATFAGFGF